MSITIGLTGNIACGKSLVSGMLRDHGAAIIDADLIGKRVLTENIDGALQQVHAAFGDGVFDGDQLNRHRLGNLVFNHPEQLQTLDGITMPIMTRLIVAELSRLRKEHGVVILDAAILIEAEWYTLVDEVWVVKAPKNEQMKRLLMRDHLSPEEARSRIEAQMPLEKKLGYADVIIDNTMDIDQTRNQVEFLWKTRLQNR